MAVYFKVSEVYLTETDDRFQRWPLWNNFCVRYAPENFPMICNSPIDMKINLSDSKWVLKYYCENSKLE